MLEITHYLTIELHQPPCLILNYNCIYIVFKKAEIRPLPRLLVAGSLNITEFCANSPWSIFFYPRSRISSFLPSLVLWHVPHSDVFGYDTGGIRKHSNKLRGRVIKLNII